ncbi:hypothetical protein [Bailinhaonella thermotolerans]|uniref:Uncharacterized protein n=1 Tax=Bailinhaonella thermotolerans TaxID=1070861 RepID=A0A3A4ANC4_9ACTN|nr:hypothetical protein [Bailinhaonella thermotolerans]RJL20671.1 hypothetical protein D5H75_39050 [Bailinhaonella thermotolerans]
MEAKSREHTRTYFLGKLAEQLHERGLAASLRAQPPSLRLTDPDVSMLTETVDCVAVADEDGAAAWFYRWSWGDLVGRADDPAAAADRIAQVFAARAGET